LWRIIGPGEIGAVSHHMTRQPARNRPKRRSHPGPASLTLLPAGGHPSWPALRDLAFALATEAAGLAARLAPGTSAAVGDLVRGMNCYYSNLIEGHDTRPVDIERALRAEFAAEPKRRDLRVVTPARKST
jgi:hypothetical protein